MADLTATVMTELAKRSTFRGVHRGWPPSFAVMPVVSVRVSTSAQQDYGTNPVGIHRSTVTIDCWCKDRQETVKTALDTSLKALHATIENQYELPEAGGVTHIVTETVLFSGRAIT